MQSYAKRDVLNIQKQTVAMCRRLIEINIADNDNYIGSSHHIHDVQLLKEMEEHLELFKK